MRSEAKTHDTTDILCGCVRHGLMRKQRQRQQERKNAVVKMLVGLII